MSGGRTVLAVVIDDVRFECGFLPVAGDVLLSYVRLEGSPVNLLPFLNWHTLQVITRAGEKLLP